jgi:hypothetical protein
MLRTAFGGLRAKVRERAGEWLERARAQAGSAAASAWLDPAHALEFIAKVRGGQLPGELGRVGGQVQRLGERAFARLLHRWPALADLVTESSQSVRRRRPAKSNGASNGSKGSKGPLDETSIEALVVQLVTAPNWQSRVSAAEALALLDGEGVPQALTRALRDTSVEVAIAAIDALARRQDRESLDALRIVLDNRDGYFSPVTRVAALSALGRLLADNELAPVMACVRDMDAEVSIGAIAVVADRKPTTAAEHLLPVLQDSSGYFLPLVRLAAANALTRAGALTPELAQGLLDREEGSSAVRRVLERAAQCPP